MAKKPPAGASPEAPPSFTALLKTPAEEAVKPPPLPVGTYQATIVGFLFDKSRNKKTPFVRFEWAIQAPGEDVTLEDLEGVKWQGKKLSQDFYITSDAVYRLKDFFESLGTDIAGKTLEELIQASKGTPGLLSIIHRSGNDPESEDVYVEIDDVAAI